MQKHSPIKLCLVSSRGGHLYQMCQLKQWWGKHERFWITGQGQDESYLLKNEKKYYGFFPESRNVINAIKNFFLAVSILRRERPTLVVSCGAGIAPPIFLAASLLGTRTLFIDSITFVKYPSMSAKITSVFATKILVQHPHMTKLLFRSEYWGGII